MPEPDDTSREAFERLDKRLDAFEAARKDKPSPLPGLGDHASEGFRMLSQLLGGVFGGLGLGWLVDRFAGTGPFGMLAGLLLGAGLSMFAVVRAAMAMNKRTEVGVSDIGPIEDDDD